MWKEYVERLLFYHFGNNYPFDGEKPFQIISSSDGKPRAITNNEDNTIYLVALTCQERFEPIRFVFQYSHELGHFWLTPLEHPFLEICSVAISLFTLSSTKDQKFQEYRNLIQLNAEEKLGLIGNKEKWKVYCLHKKSKAAICTICDSEHILAGSLMVDDILDCLQDWRPLSILHKFVSFNENTNEYLVNFQDWKKAAVINSNNEISTSSINSISFVEKCIVLFGDMFSEI